MRNFLLGFFTHKDLYIASISLGTLFSFMINFIVKLSGKELFGISMTLWGLALIINIIDIHTGIKADTKRKADKGLKFKFESGKGWRAIEKIFVFTVITAFVYHSEREFIRLGMTHWISSMFLYIKLTMFFYVILIEIQSIGENDEVRFGKKGKAFIILDNLIEIVNVGITDKVKGLFNTTKTQENE